MYLLYPIYINTVPVVIYIYYHNSIYIHIYYIYPSPNLHLATLRFF